jgi:quercetin dioxygenase-like cupin family protein
MAETPTAPTVIAPDDGIRYQARGSQMLFKAVAATTDGAFSLMDRTLPPGGRMPPAHRHDGNAEAYLVAEGEVTFVLEGETTVGGPGTFALVPAGAGHTFGNTSHAPARLLVLHTPALDGYFAELETLWAGAEPPSAEDERGLMARHGMRPA